MKTRCETKRGGRASPHFVIRNRTEHLLLTLITYTYTISLLTLITYLSLTLDVEGAVSMNDLSKHF